MEITRLTKLLAAIRALPGGRDSVAWDTVCDVYFDALRYLPDSVSDSVTAWIVSTQQYRPAVATILMHAKTLGIADPVAQIRDEITDAVNQYGENGRRDPQNARIRLPGAPPLSKVAQEAVQSLGGWFRVCEAARERQDLFSAKIAGAAEVVVRRSRREPAIESYQEVGA